MIRRLFLLVVSGALLVALAATAAFAQEAPEIIEGTDDSEYIVGGPGAQYIRGLGGHDWLDGGSGTDSVRGGAGHDLVDGGTGNDTVVGGTGNDYVTGFLGFDGLSGGPGSDFIYAADGTVDAHIGGGPGYDICVIDWADYFRWLESPYTIEGCEELYIE